MKLAFDKGIFLKNGGFGRAQNTFTFCPNRKLGVSYRRIPLVWHEIWNQKGLFGLARDHMGGLGRDHMGA